MDYWKNMSEEDMNVFEGDWDQDLALEVSREEGWEDGWEDGREEGREERDRHLLALIEQGYTTEDLKRELSARA